MHFCQGHRIFLPEDINIAEPLPLIVIGAGKALRLQNVTLVHSESLAACLQLGAGARLSAELDDGVKMIKGTDPEMADSELQVTKCLLLCQITVRRDLHSMSVGSACALPFKIYLGQIVICNFYVQCRSE